MNQVGGEETSKKNEEPYGWLRNPLYNWLDEGRWVKIREIPSLFPYALSGQTLVKKIASLESGNTCRLKVRTGEQEESHFSGKSVFLNRDSVCYVVHPTAKSYMRYRRVAETRKRPKKTKAPSNEEELRADPDYQEILAKKRLEEMRCFDEGAVERGFRIPVVKDPFRFFTIKGHID